MCVKLVNLLNHRKSYGNSKDQGGILVHRRGMIRAPSIATDRALFFIRKMLISFLLLHENICCGYSLEAPRRGARGASNEYPQHMFSWRNKKNIMWIPPLICSYVPVCSIWGAFKELSPFR